MWARPPSPLQIFHSIVCPRGVVLCPVGGGNTPIADNRRSIARSSVVLGRLLDAMKSAESDVVVCALRTIANLSSVGAYA